MCLKFIFNKNEGMKIKSPDKSMFRRSISKITNIRDYEYALWEAGYKCAINQIRKLNNSK